MKGFINIKNGANLNALLGNRNVIDPTGAGDSFAGGYGISASKNSHTFDDLKMPFVGEL